MRPAILILLVLVMIVWGSNFVVAKWGFLELQPMLLLAVRFLLVGLILIPFVAWPAGKIWHVLGLSVVLGALHFGLMFNGVFGLGAGVAAIAIQLQVPFAALLAAVVLGDYLGWRRAIGMAFAFLGIVLIAGAPSLTDNLFYLVLVVLASFMWAISTVQVKFMGDAPPFSVLGWSSLFAAPQLLVLSLIFEDGQWAQLQSAGWYGWGAVAFMTLGVSLFGYGVWYVLLRTYDINQMMPMTLLVPVVGVATGMVFLDEVLTWQIAVGAALTLAGVAVIVLYKPKPVTPAMKAVGDEAR